MQKTSKQKNKQKNTQKTYHLDVITEMDKGGAGCLNQDAV